MTTIEERIRTAHHAAILALAGSKQFEQQNDPSIAAAIQSALEEAIDTLFWLTLLPGTVANCPAPTDDEAEDATEDVSEGDLPPDEIDSARRRRYVVDAFLAERATKPTKGRR